MPIQVTPTPSSERRGAAQKLTPPSNSATRILREEERADESQGFTDAQYAPRLAGKRRCMCFDIREQPWPPTTTELRRALGNEVSY